MKTGIEQLAAAALLALAACGTYAHDDAHGKAKTRSAVPVETAFGRSADASQASRTVKVSMSDTMRFSPDTLELKRGETVRFVVANDGKTMHELVIGTMDDLKRHAELMRKFPRMEHDEPYMAHVPPGKVETMAWQFTRPGDFYYGCLIPGHFEAGMIGRVTVR